MSVVRREAAGRWATVAAGTATLCALPFALAAVPARPPEFFALARLQAVVLASVHVPHTGLAESTAALAVPDLPRLGEVGDLLGGTTRTRVWWAAPDRWRVDTLTPAGERGLYAARGGLLAWDFEHARLTAVRGAPSARLPRPDDLLPPQAARRALAAMGRGDRLESLPGRRVVGRTAAGLRIAPADPRSSIAAVEIWLDARKGLPLEVRVRARGAPEPVLVSRFLAVRLGAPDPRHLTPRHGPGVTRDATTTPDLAALVDRQAPWALPPRLAGLQRTGGLPARRAATTGGVATYGTGLTRFTVLPLPGGLAGQMLRRAVQAGATPLPVRGGTALQVRGGVLAVTVARGADGDHAYLLAGTVTPAVLQRAAAELFARPPGLR